MNKNTTDFFLSNPIERFSQEGIATVVMSIQPQKQGRVQFQGTEWFASFDQDNALTSAMPDTQVKVVGRKGISLLIAPLSLATT